jgi:hypothetical protein
MEPVHSVVCTSYVENTWINDPKKDTMLDDHSFSCYVKNTRENDLEKR